MLSRQHKGFTLIELMITIAIVGILAAVAVPQYARYTERAKFSDVVTQTATYKTAVSLCAQEESGLDNCSAGVSPTIPADIQNQGFIASITTLQGEINAVGNSEVNGHTYTLTPTWTANSSITWASSGSCVAAGYCPQQ